MTITELQELTKQVAIISTEIGTWMKSQRVTAEQTEIKSTNNLVSYVDKESESRFVKRLKDLFPDAGFIAEEGTGEKKSSGYNWVIDPLDGTTNFIHGVPIWCTSVALVKDNIPVIGVIYDPNNNECFDAFLAGGARLNRKPIRVCNTASLESALLVTGFPYDDFGREAQYMKLLQILMHSTRGIRRLGSAALDLAWVACGRFEAFYEYGLNPWDVAAGACIVSEAGGMVTGFTDGDPVFGEDLVASNGKVHSELISIINDYFSNH